MAADLLETMALCYRLNDVFFDSAPADAYVFDSAPADAYTFSPS